MVKIKKIKAVLNDGLNALELAVVLNRVVAVERLLDLLDFNTQCAQFLYEREGSKSQNIFHLVAIFATWRTSHYLSYPSSLQGKAALQIVRFLRRSEKLSAVYGLDCMDSSGMKPYTLLECEWPEMKALLFFPSESQLRWGVLVGNESILRRSLRCGHNPNALNSQNQNSLHFLVKEYDAKIKDITYLIRCDQENKFMQHHRIVKSRIFDLKVEFMQLANLFLQFKADRSQKDIYGKIPADYTDLAKLKAILKPTVLLTISQTFFGAEWCMREIVLIVHIRVCLNSQPVRRKAIRKPKRCRLKYYLFKL